MGDFIITGADLSKYVSGFTTLAAETADLYAELANGMVLEITGPFTGDAPVRAKVITLELAARGLGNRGPTSVTTTADGTSKTIRREGSAAGASASMDLTPGERAELLVLAGKIRRRRPRTIRLAVP